MAGFKLGQRKESVANCIVGFVFGAFIEGMAGAAALLIGSDFLPLAAIRSALILKSVSVSYGIVGIPTNTAAATVEVAQQVAANNAEGFRIVADRKSNV